MNNNPSPTEDSKFQKEGNNQESDTDCCKEALKKLLPRNLYFTPNGALSTEPVFFSKDWY